MRIKRMELGPGQESVWDYPRPPRLETSTRHIQVIFGGVTIADTWRALRVLETSHPPVYYLPPDDVRMEFMFHSSYHSYCEWKGTASYYTIKVNGRSASRCAWTYFSPEQTYRTMAGYIAFYPSVMDQCLVDGESVRAQSGDFYGGWITSMIVGPFKGDPGTAGW